MTMFRMVVFLSVACLVCGDTSTSVDGETNKNDPSPKQPPPPGSGDGIDKRSTEEGCVSPPAGNVTAVQIQQFLDTHNEARSHEGASNMMRMDWDSTLASRAQAWADNCHWDHNYVYSCSGASLGQNMFMSSYDHFDNMTAVTLGWLSEKDFYHYFSDTCDDGEMCGHYTQAVWYKSKQVGCGVKFCPVVTMPKPEDDPWYNSIVVVCDYFPSGNWDGEKPFNFGEACSDCPVERGQKCINGTCVDCVPADDQAGNCECRKQCPPNSTYDPDACTCTCDADHFELDGNCVLCQNEYGESSCSYWQGNGFCEESSPYHAFMMEKCSLICGACTLD